MQPVTTRSADVAPDRAPLPAPDVPTLSVAAAPPPRQRSATAGLSPRDWSLRTKLVGLVAVLLAAVSLFLLAFFPARMDRLSRRWVDRRATGIAGVLASASAPGLEFDDAANLGALLKSLSTAPEVRYAAVRRADGSILAAFQPDRIGKLAAATVACDAEPVLRDEGDDLQVVAAVCGKGGGRGSLVAGFSRAELRSERAENVRAAGLVAGAVFVLGLFIAGLFGTLLVRPIERMTEVALRIADGDLSQPRLDLPRRDEVGRMAEAFDRMVDAQHAVLRQVTETSNALAAAAAEIYAASQEQEAASSEQSASVEEVTRTVQSLLDSAGHISESAREVLGNAEQTRQTTELAVRKIAELSGHTSRISEILEVIREISDRSDLLALNAALEGTRAGEAGQGFSLVAAEMRRLAERVGASVQDIKALVGDVHSSSSSTVVASEEGRKLAEDATESARRITMVTQQQRTATEQVSQSMKDIASMVGQSTSAVRQTRELAGELKAQADRLAQVVGRFRLASEAPAGS